jgi:hypothetical protein
MFLGRFCTAINRKNKPAVEGIRTLLQGTFRSPLEAVFGFSPPFPQRPHSVLRFQHSGCCRGQRPPLKLFCVSPSVPREIQDDAA